MVATRQVAYKKCLGWEGVLWTEDKNRMQRHRGKKLKTETEGNLLIFFTSPSNNTPPIYSYMRMLQDKS